MTTFDDREDAFERRFAHDEALDFKARARRTHKLGLWAAGQLGREPGEAGRYADGLVSLEVGSGSEAVVHKVLDDREAAGLERNEAEVRQHMAAWLTEAEREVRAG